MKANELRALENVELEKKCKDLQEGLFKLKFQLSLGQLEDTATIMTTKKDIARIKTVLHERTER